MAINIERRVVFYQFVIDFESNLIGLTQSHDIRFNLFQKLGESGLHRHLQSFLNNIISILVH